jgi:hypothetical protein
VNDYDELRSRLSERARQLKEDGDWQTCDLLREARNAIEKLTEADEPLVLAGQSSDCNPE